MKTSIDLANQNANFAKVHLSNNTEKYTLYE